MAEVSGTGSSKYTIFQANFDSLVNVVKADVAEVSRKAFSKVLISRCTMNIANNPMFDENYRTTSLLSNICCRIEDNDIAFDEFITILRGIPVVCRFLPKSIADISNTKVVSDHDEVEVVTTIQETVYEVKTLASNMETVNRSILPDNSFLCACKQCTLKVYLADKCPNAGTNPYPYLDMEHLDKVSQVDLIAKLQSRVERIGISFANLICSTRTSLNTQGIHPKDLAVCVLSLQAIVHKPLLTKDEDKILSAESVSDILLTLMPYVSFFNYEVLKHIINDLGTDEDRKNLKFYEDSFHDFCKKNVFEVPPNVYGLTSSAHESLFAVKVMEAVPNESITVSTVLSVRRKIAEILEVNTSCLYLLRVDKGCIQLVFLIPAFVAEEVFPLTSPKLASLADNGISVIIQSGLLKQNTDLLPPNSELPSNGSVTQIEASLSPFEPEITEQPPVPDLHHNESTNETEQHDKTPSEYPPLPPYPAISTYFGREQYSSFEIPAIVDSVLETTSYQGSEVQPLNIPATGPTLTTVTYQEGNNDDISTAKECSLLISCNIGDDTNRIYWQVQDGTVIGTSKKQNASYFYLLPDREHPDELSIGYKYHESEVMNYVKANLNWRGHNSGPLEVQSYVNPKQARVSLQKLCLQSQNVDSTTNLKVSSAVVWQTQCFYIKCARRRPRKGYIAMKERTSETETQYYTQCVHQSSGNEPGLWVRFQFEPFQQPVNVVHEELVSTISISCTEDHPFIPKIVSISCTEDHPFVPKIV